MKNKLLALVCLMVLVVGVVFSATPKADAAEQSYQVGFARVDINPYNVDGDPSSGIMHLPLRGSGDVWNRLSTDGLVDDNGDGVIDANDGLKATCVAVTDANGNTVLMINVDLIGGTMISKVNTAIMERVEAAVAAGEITNVNLTKEQIYYGGTHTHNAPDTSVYTSKGKTGTNNDGVDLGPVNENLGIWIDRTVEDIADAAIIALKDRAAATITKDQLSASNATDEVVKGKKMVTTRHLINGEDGSIAGDNFNDRGDNPTQITEADDTIYLLKFSFKDSSKLPVIFTSWRGHPSLNNSDSYDNGGKNCMSSDYVNAYRHALEFGVDVTIDKDYGVGHVTSWELGDTQKYRVIFFNGTGGNTNPRNTEVQRDANGNALTYGSGTVMRGYSWIDVSASKAEVKGRGCSYGVVLATMAQECLDDGKNAASVTYGDIKTMQKKFTADRKTTGVSQIGYNAGTAYWEADAMYDKALSAYNTANSKFTAYKNAYNDYKNAGVLGFLYKSKMETALKEYNTANSNLNSLLTPYVEYMTAHTNNTPTQASTTTVNGTAGPTKPLQSHPFIYKEGDQVYPVGSRFHASAVQGDWNNKLGIVKSTTGVSITLNTIMIGKELAFVVVPGEPFDYYYKQTGVYTAENNLWKILENETYGKPIVLGYTNGSSGYFPNYEAYFYNQGSTTKVMGAYETHTSDMEAGSGEKMVYVFHAMLSAMNGEGRTAYCAHCKQEVEWTPFVGQAVATGHYYLASDVEGPQTKIPHGSVVCLDLNGYTYTGESRAFYNDTNVTAAADKATLNIMDSSAAGTGVVTGRGGTLGPARGYGGGTIILSKGHELNLYGGTITSYEKGDYGAYSGTVLLIRGNMNMYGGHIKGGISSSVTGDFYYSDKINTHTRTGMGGALYLTGTLNMYGGKITTGSAQLITGEVIGSAELGYANKLTVTPIEGVSNCVCLGTYSGTKGQINLYNDASIDQIYFDGLDSSRLNVYGNYSGTAELKFSGKTEFALGELVGNAHDANTSRSAITVAGCEGVAAANGNALVLAEKPWTYYYCEACEETVQWQPMNEAEFDVYNGVSAGATKLPTGHYRLDSDVTETDQKQLNANGDHPGTFCIDLAGHTFTGKTRAFYVYDDATLNIFDSVGGAVLEGKCSSSTGGGVIYVQGKSDVNLYGGTVRHNNPKVSAILNGGCVRVNGGTFRMYGGTLEGKDVTERGCAIYASVRSGAVATVELYGGTIKGAKAEKGGNCVYISDKCPLVLAGDPVIDDVYFAAAPSKSLTVDTTADPFTGAVNLTCATAPAAGTSLGTCLGSNGITPGSMILTNNGMAVSVSGGQLVTEVKAFRLVGKEGIYASFDTFQEAMDAYTYDASQGNYIQLTKDVSGAAIYKELYVDLNGFYLSAPVVQDCVNLHCKDAQTDDYTIEDDMAYGMVYNAIVEGEGTITAMDGYLMIHEGNGFSFHKVDLRIKSMSLRSSAAGVYYTCDFKGDEIVSENVKSYGIALSAWIEPDAKTLDEMCLYTAATEFAPGADGNASNGVLLSGIMKSTNSAEKNRANGEIAVYGRAYIETVDGYMFGESVSRSLKDQMESIDAIWSQLSAVQKDAIQTFYATYAEAMKTWNLTNIPNG